ncbi:hypothetical protein E3N88_33499 [Mikania micrantha]|uniref:Uncharacterized protein n=1 Tax=Mikania micrantha TaxID=192012 RepID=A0A5N6ME12_9ASTR|nr:hypothetical protein E3N88_33499 [Mikania micrantha]
MLGSSVQNSKLQSSACNPTYANNLTRWPQHDLLAKTCRKCWHASSIDCAQSNPKRRKIPTEDGVMSLAPCIYAFTGEGGLAFLLDAPVPLTFDCFVPVSRFRDNASSKSPLRYGQRDEHFKSECRQQVYEVIKWRRLNKIMPKFWTNDHMLASFNPKNQMTFQFKTKSTAF